jgi:hypothetical protein
MASIAAVTSGNENHSRIVLSSKTQTPSAFSKLSLAEILSVNKDKKAPRFTAKGLPNFQRNRSPYRPVLTSIVLPSTSVT